MNEATIKMIKGWITMHRGDLEGVARWMSRALRQPLKECRQLVHEAAKHD